MPVNPDQNFQYQNYRYIDILKPGQVFQILDRNANATCLDNESILHIIKVGTAHNH